MNQFSESRLPYFEFGSVDAGLLSDVFTLIFCPLKDHISCMLQMRRVCRQLQVVLEMSMPRLALEFPIMNTYLNAIDMPRLALEFPIMNTYLHAIDTHRLLSTP